MINFYEKYKDDFEMLVVRADREGRVDILEEIFLAKKRLNILEMVCLIGTKKKKNLFIKTT